MMVAKRIHIVTGMVLPGVLGRAAGPKILPSLHIGTYIFQDLYALSALSECGFLFSQFGGYGLPSFSPFTYCWHFGSASPSQDFLPGINYALIHITYI